MGCWEEGGGKHFSTCQKETSVVFFFQETVLDNMAEEGSLRTVRDAPVETSRLQEGATCCPWAESMTVQIDRLSGEMTALHSQLQELVARRRSAWCQKVRFGAAVMMGSNSSDPLFFSSPCCVPSQGSLPVGALCQPTIACLFMPTACQVLFQTQSKQVSQRGGVLKTKQVFLHLEGKASKDRGYRGENEKRGEVVAASGGDGGSRLKASVVVAARKIQVRYSQGKEGVRSQNLSSFTELVFEMPDGRRNKKGLKPVK